MCLVEQKIFPFVSFVFIILLSLQKELAAGHWSYQDEHLWTTIYPLAYLSTHPLLLKMRVFLNKKKTVHLSKSMNEGSF